MHTKNHQFHEIFNNFAIFAFIYQVISRKFGFLCNLTVEIHRFFQKIPWLYSKPYDNISAA